MDTNDSLRQQLVSLLTKAEAHVDARAELRDFPVKLRGSKPQGAPHTPWQLLEHMRLAQWDILRFSVDRKHKSPKFPEGYWPKTSEPPNDAAWDGSVKMFLADLEEMCGLVRDKKRDLFAPITHGQGQTLLREVLLVADHNAYHLGQLVLLRRSMEKE
ncbi:MAG TPA: DinB family protein [Candidatus Angelobacter sp.]|nr:DinB family protein [Candidatus Angelobacter sp.]